jgi:uncharacterized protein YceK
MFKRFCAFGVSAALAVTGGGCGTVFNMRDENFRVIKWGDKVPPMTVFGGVRLDALEASETAKDITTGAVVLTGTGTRDGEIEQLTQKERWVLGPLWMLACVVDLSLSVVGDTVTLPITLFAGPTAEKKSAAPPTSPAP